MARSRGAVATVVALALAIGLGACSMFGFQMPSPGPLLDGDVYTGSDAATVIITTQQVGCCYIEGSLRFARLDGPSTLEWAVDGGTGGGPDGDVYPIGLQVITLKPGEYTLTEWEEVCDANCGNLDPPANHCTIDFAAAPGDAVEILVSFTIPQPCVAALR